jgi:hypothetical protein
VIVVVPCQYVPAAASVMLLVATALIAAAAAAIASIMVSLHGELAWVAFITSMKIGENLLGWT